MTNLREGTQELIKNREHYLQDAHHARELLELLPEEIILLQGNVDYNKCGNDPPTLSIRVYGKGSDIILKRNGVTGFIYGASSPLFFSAKGGEFKLPNGIIAYFEAWNIDKPNGCKLEEYTTTAYKVVCD